MNPYAGLTRRLGRSRLFAWAASRVMPPLDRGFVRRRRSISSFGTGLPLCFLTVHGRRTGALRTVPLLHVADGERVVLVASNWGRSNHPAWALNLEANPDVTVTVGGVVRTMKARPATVEERAHYWEQALVFWPAYDVYRRRAGREIRMFVLDPA